MARRRSRGEGSLYFLKSKGLWVSNITLPDKTRKVKYGKKQSEVRTYHLTILNELRQGILPKNDVITLGEFLGSYMETVGKNILRPRTQEMYNSLINVHIVPSIGKIKLAQLGPDHLQNFYSQKLKEGLSRRTVQLLHSTMRTALKQAVTWALCDYNDETRRANNLVSRAQEKRHVSGPKQQVSRRRNEDRSSRQGQASTASGGIQAAHSA